MNSNDIFQISSPTKISIITRLRGANSSKINEQNNNSSLSNLQYTIFTQRNSSPSDILYVSENPLNASKINEILNSKDQNVNLNYFNYDKVYPESYSLDLIYQQILQNPINDLFYKKNSCMLFFGPTMGGKSYLLRGSQNRNENESGLLTRAIKEIFQKIEFNSNFCVKVAVYQIYLNYIYDLLSNDNNPKLSIDSKYGELNSNYNVNILGLTKKEIKNSNEYDMTLRESINNRKNLSQTLGINDIKKKSHFIISIYLENKVENTNNFLPFSQFDFVELVSSNYGLLNEKENNINIDDNLFQNTNNVFNSIAENIISLSQGSLSTKDSVVTLSLKNTMRLGCNIILMNCVVPWEFPLDPSYNSLKFASSIYSQICKGNNNSNYFNNFNSNNSINNLTLEFSNSNSCNHLTKDLNSNANSNQNNIININDSNYEKMNEYLNSLTIDKIDYLFPEKEFPNSNNNIRNNNKNSNDNNNAVNYKNKVNNNLFTKYKGNKNNYAKPNKALLRKNKNISMNKSYDDETKSNTNREKNNRNHTKKNNSKKKKNSKNISLNYESISPKEQKLIKLNEALKELEEKSKELNRTSRLPEYIYTTTNTTHNIKNKNYFNFDNNNNNINTNIIDTIQTDNNNKLPEGYNNNTIPTTNTNTNIQFEKIKEEYSDLKSNNIILKEDLSQLKETNKNLEESLIEQRGRNLEIINQNEELSNRILKLESLLDEAGIREEKYKINEINIEKLLNEKLYLNSKINEDEKEYKRMKEEKENYEVEYKVLDAKYAELKNNYDFMYNDYCNIKASHEEQFNKIEDKVDNFLKEIEKLQNENNSLRNENERLRIEINGIGTQRDDYKDKYSEEKNKNDLLSVKIAEIENELNNFKKEKMNEDFFKLKSNEYKKNKNERKMKIVNDLQDRILKYKEQRLKKGMED